MKDIYNISKGQLVTILIFGLIGTLLSAGYAADEESATGAIFAILISFLVIFYTVGWRERHKEEWDSIKSWRPQKSIVKKVAWGLLIWFILLVVVALFTR